MPLVHSRQKIGITDSEEFMLRQMVLKQLSRNPKKWLSIEDTYTQPRRHILLA